MSTDDSRGMRAGFVLVLIPLVVAATIVGRWVKREFTGA